MNKLSDNFELLISRKQGQLFDVKEGKLVTMSTLQKIRYIIQKSYREAVQERLRPIVSSLVGRITDEAQLQTLKHLPISIFDRTALNTNFLAAMTPALTEQTDSPVMNETIQKIQLAFRLGIRPQGTDEGCSGSYFLKDIQGKKLAIFKPSDEEVLASNTSKLSSKMKRLFYRIFPHFSPTAVHCMSGEGYKAEEAASRISESLNLPTVPLTRITRLTHPDFYYSTQDRARGTLPEKEGSLQIFIQQSQTAEVSLSISNQSRFRPRFYQWLLGLPSWTNFLKARISQEEFERFVIIDYIVGNLDRHFANWMINSKEEIKAIDNGYAIPHKHTETRRTNQYLWTILPHAKVPFSDKAREIIAELHKQNIAQDLITRGLITNSQRKCLEDRIQVVSYFVEYGKTPRELGKIKQAKDFKKAFRTMPIAR